MSLWRAPLPSFISCNEMTDLLGHAASRAGTACARRRYPTAHCPPCRHGRPWPAGGGCRATGGVEWTVEEGGGSSSSVAWCGLKDRQKASDALRKKEASGVSTSYPRPCVCLRGGGVWWVCGVGGWVDGARSESLSGAPRRRSMPLQPTSVPVPWAPDHPVWYQ